MDLTDRNNEKYTKILGIAGGKKYQVHFYYNRITKDFKYWGISRGGFSPSAPWDEIIEQYIVENNKDELIELAEYDIKVRAGKGGNGQAGFGDVSPDKVYPKKNGRG